MTTDTAGIVDGCARVIAAVIEGKVFAAAVTESVVSAEPEVVPLADDFSAAGLPAVTCAVGSWKSLLQPGNERLHLTINGVVWRPRVPLGVNVNALYGDRDAIAQGWIEHTKAYLTDATLQSAILEGGPGIVPRSLGDPINPRRFLTLPFTVNVVCNRTVVPQPA